MRYCILLLYVWVSATTVRAQDLASAKSLTRTTPVSTAAATTLPQPKAVASPLYVKFYGFYSLLTPGSQLTTSTTKDLSSANSTFKTNSTGLGSGPRAGIGIGLVVSDFINVGIDADMLFGSNLTTTNSYATNNYTYNNTSSVMLKLVSVTPNVTFKALSRPAYYIYNRVGISIGKVLDYKTSQKYQSTSSGTSSFGESHTEFTKTSLAIGYQAALGIQVRLSEKLRGFLEAVVINQSFQPKESVASSSTKGIPNANSSFVYQYEKQGEYLTTTNSDGLHVYQQPITTIAVNSLGVGVGLLFRL